MVQKLKKDQILRDMENIYTIVYLSIPYDGFRIFGVLDDTGFLTTATGIETRRRYGFKLLVCGVEYRKMVLNSFLLLNCYTSFNQSNNNFNIRPPTIEEYIPLNEIIKLVPNVSDGALSDVYTYYM